MQYHIIFKTATQSEWVIDIVTLSKIENMNINFKLLSSHNKTNVYISRENDLILESYRYSLINISFKRDSNESIKYIFKLNQYKIPIIIPSSSTYLKICSINCNVSQEPNKDLLYSIKEMKPNFITIFCDLLSIHDFIKLTETLSILTATNQLFIINHHQNDILNLICTGSLDDNFLVHHLGNIVLVKSKFDSDLDELLNIIKKNVSKTTRQVIWFNNTSIHTIPMAKLKKFKEIDVDTLNDCSQYNFRESLLQNNIFKSIRLTLISNTFDTTISRFSHILEPDIYQLNVGTIYNNRIGKVQTKILKAYYTKLSKYSDWKVNTLPWLTMDQDTNMISQFHPNYLIIDEIGKDLLVSCTSINNKGTEKTHYINIDHQINPLRFIQYIKRKMCLQYHI